MLKLLKNLFSVTFLFFIYSCLSDDDCKCHGAFYTGSQTIIVSNVDCETGAPGYTDPLFGFEYEYLGCSDN